MLRIRGASSSEGCLLHDHSSVENINSESELSLYQSREFDSDVNTSCEDVDLADLIKIHHFRYDIDPEMEKQNRILENSNHYSMRNQVDDSFVDADHDKTDSVSDSIRTFDRSSASLKFDESLNSNAGCTSGEYAK